MRGSDVAAMRRGGALAVICLSLIAVPAVLAEGKAAKVQPLTGTFVGKTSQKFSFRFKLEKHNSTDDCGTAGDTYCFIVLKYPDLKEPCVGGGAITGIYGMTNGILPSSGIYHYHQPLDGAQQPEEDEWVYARAHSISGHFREVSETDLGTGTLVRCDTGVVTWTSQRISKHY